MASETKGKHTPGPWNYWPEDFDDDELDGDFVVGSVVSTSPFNGRPVRWGTVCERVPNEVTARLIAAAPDLLAALEGLMEWEREIGLDLALHTSPDGLLVAAHDAIAKAKGVAR